MCWSSASISTWSAVGNLTTAFNTWVFALLELPDGDVVAGGHELRSAGLDCGLVRWDGTSWQTSLRPAGDVVALGLTRDADLVVGGGMLTPSNAFGLAFLRSTCPASAMTSGAGCTGSGGPNTLTAAAQPWIGATFRARATGLAPNSLVIGVRGLATGSTPLAPALPQALPGCNLLVSPDLLDLHLPQPSVPGSADIQFAIPDVPALAGGVMHLQVVPVVFGAGGGITEFSASNALTLTIGVW